MSLYIQKLLHLALSACSVRKNTPFFSICSKVLNMYFCHRLVLRARNRFFPLLIEFELFDVCFVAYWQINQYLVINASVMTSIPYACKQLVIHLLGLGGLPMIAHRAFPISSAIFILVFSIVLVIIIII